MFELKTIPLEEMEEEGTIELFSIDGKVYTIPDREKPAAAMRYLYMARKRGVGIAESWLAEELLGTEAYEALLDFKDLKQGQMDEIIISARAVAFGELRPKVLSKANGRALRTEPKQGSRTTKTTNGSRKPKQPSSPTSADSTE